MIHQHLSLKGTGPFIPSKFQISRILRLGCSLGTPMTGQTRQPSVPGQITTANFM